MRVSSGSSLQLGNSSLDIIADQLSVSEQTSSTPLLSVSAEGVNVGTSVGVTGSLGVTIGGPLETSQVQSPGNQDLLIQSLSGELHLTGGRGISLRDGPGFDGVAVSSNSDLTITSQNGQVGHLVKQYYWVSFLYYYCRWYWTARLLQYRGCQDQDRVIGMKCACAGHRELFIWYQQAQTVRKTMTFVHHHSNRTMKLAQHHKINDEAILYRFQNHAYRSMAFLEETPIPLPAPLKTVLEDDCFWVLRRAKVR